MSKGKMTRADLIEAYTMRLDGKTLQEIADKFGVTREYIRQVAPGPRKIRNNVFPNIQKYIDTHNLCLYEFAELIGTSNTAINNWFNGTTEPKLYYIRKILAVTGMDFHTAFAIEGSEDGND